MRFVILFLLIVVGALGLGVYRGWFHIASENNAGMSNVTLTVDKAKVEQDKDTAVEKAQHLEHRMEEKAKVALDRDSRPASKPATQP